MSDHTPGPCPYCQTQMENCGAPIWEDYCPNKACTGHRDAFWADLREKKHIHPVMRALDSVMGYSDADALRDLQDSILQSTSLADFISVKKTVEAIRESEGGQ